MDAASRCYNLGAGELQLLLAEAAAFSWQGTRRGVGILLRWALRLLTAWVHLVRVVARAWVGIIVALAAATGQAGLAALQELRQQLRLMLRGALHAARPPQQQQQQQQAGPRRAAAPQGAQARGGSSSDAASDAVAELLQLIRGLEAGGTRQRLHDALSACWLLAGLWMGLAYR